MAYKNKEDQRNAARRHYDRHKQRYVDRALKFTNQARKRNKRFIRDHLAGHPCIDCGESDPVVLDFDHVFGVKYRTISKMVSMGYGLRSIKREIAKCEVRCANCHRRVTHRRRKELAAQRRLGGEVIAKVKHRPELQQRLFDSI